MEVSMESEDRADLSECVLILGLPRQASAKEVGQCVFSVAGVTVRRVAPVKVPTGDGTPLQGWLVQLKSSDDQQRCLQHQGTFRIPDGKGELIEITLTYPALASLPSSESEEWITIEENPTTDKGSATSTPTSPLHTSCARETSRTIPSAPPCTNNFFSLQMSDGAPYPQTPAATSQGLEAQGSEPVANTQQHVQVYTNPYSEGSPRSDLPGAPQYFPGHVYFPGGQGSPQAFSSQPQPPYPQSYPSPLVYPPVPQAAMQGPCPPNLLRYPQHYPGAYVPQQFARAPGGNNQSQGIRPPPGFTVQHASPRRGLYPSIHPQQNLYHQQQGFPPDQNQETAGPGGHPLTPRPIPRPRKSLQKAVSQHSSQTCSPQSEHSPGQQYEAVAADPPVQQAQTSRSDQHRLTSNAHRKQVEAEMCQLATSDTRTDSRESRSQIPEKKLLPTSQADPGGSSGSVPVGRKDTGGQDSNQEDEEMREQVAVEGGSSRTVEVLAGPGKMKSEEMYQYYFENPRHGGGDIEKLVLDENRRTIIITFEDADVARRIVEREHKIGGKLLTVRLHVPADARPTYPDKLLFQDVPDSTDKEHLETYLELVAGCTPIEILYGDESGTVLVTFDGEPDYQEVQENLRKKKKLQGRQLVVSRVPVSNCLLVENIGPSTSLETVVLYFENTRRSQGGPLERWEVLDGGEDQRCLLHFKDYKVVERILEKTHSIDERELHVRRYLECLGSSGGIVDPTVFDVPKPITLKDVDKFKLAFIRHSRNARDNFFQTLSKIHAKTKFVDNTVILECTLGPNVPQARVLVRTWRKDVQKKVLECLALIKVERVDVIDQIWPEVEKAVDDSDVQSSEDASVSPLQEEKTFVIVGRKEAVEVLKQKIKDRMEVVEKEVERKKQEVTNTVTTLKHYQLRLLEVISFQKQVTEQRKNLTVEINPQGITFHGLLPDVREAQVQMFNELNSAKLHRISKMSSPKKKLLGYKETQHYIQTMFKTEGVIAVWDICEQGEVIVYGFDEDSLSKAAHFLHMSVFDHVLELSAESSKLLQSTDWQLLGKTLLEKHQGTLLIHPSHDGKELILVGTADIMEAVTEMVENFFETNTLYRVVVSFSPSRQRFLAMYWRDRLEKIAQNLTKYKVQTSLAASDSEVLVEGTKQGVRLAIQELEELEKRIVCHEEKLTKRHELMFLTDEQSGKDLNMLEKSNRCVVSRTPEAPGLESLKVLVTVAPTETSDTSGVTPMEVDLQTENLPRHSDMQGKSLPTADAVGTGSNLPSAAITPIKVIIIEGEIAKEKAFRQVQSQSGVTPSTNTPARTYAAAVAGAPAPAPTTIKVNIIEGEIAQQKVFRQVQAQHGLGGTPQAFPARGLINTTTTPSHGQTAAANRIKVSVVVGEIAKENVFQQVKNQFSTSFAPSGQAQSASTGHRHQRTFTDSTEGKSQDSRGSLPEAEFEIKGLRLVVVHGDIADEAVEVVVNVTNSQLDLTLDYVAISLGVRCGKALEQALNARAADIQKKGIAVTEAFNLTSRLILHIAVDKFANDWEGAIKLCLKEAEVYKVKSIAMPALGTGHGLTASDFAKVLLRAINKHFGREKRALLQIRVVMCDRVQVPPFTAAIKALCDNPEQNNVIKGFKALKNMAKGIPNLPVVEVPKPVTASPRSPLSLTEAHFYIYAESNLSVEAFLKAFRDLVSEKFTREEIQDNLLQTIDSALAERLQQTANGHDVEMELQAAFGRMVLDGLKTNVFNAHKDIIQLLRAAERQNQEARAASVVANIVQWYFMEVTNTGFERKKYPPKENHLIETAFQNKDKTVEIMDADKNVFVVDFDLMQEYPKGDKNDPVNVIRREKLQDSDTGLNQLPDTWAPNQKEPVLVIPVTSGSPEYREVEANFRKTLGSVKATVIS
ncbi:hypothetical protein BaRGS_00009431, partial [Batillaria attramentaria]